MAFRDLTLTDISRQIIALELRARTHMGGFLELIAEFDAREGARDVGQHGTSEWLAHYCDIDGRTARDYVRVARRLRAWPKIGEALGEGRLSYTKVRALTRAAETEDEAQLLRVALTCTASKLEQHVRQLRSAPSADLDIANQGRAKRHVTHFWEEDGSLRFFGRLAAEDGAVFVESIEARAAMIYGEDGDPCCPEGWKTPPIGARRADALIELITGEGGVETHIVLHAGADVLHLQDGPAIPVEVAQRLACDARVSLDGLNRGRTARTITKLQRRALEARDGRICSFPGCTRTHGLQGHHIDPWENGGRTDLDNLELYCLYHHKLFHDYGWTVRRNRKTGSTTITDPRGREVPERAPPPRLALAA